MSKATSYEISNIQIKNLLNPIILEKMKTKFLDMDAISLVFIKKENNKKDSPIFPLVLGHQNSINLEKGIIRLECPDEESLEKFKEILIEMGGQ